MSSTHLNVDDRVVSGLREICGDDRVSTEEKRLTSYGRDKITEEHYAGRADVVVWPAGTEEVVQVVQLARAMEVPITPRGGGSGLSGGAVPVRGGIVMAMERMNQVLEVDTDNLVVVLEPGVVTKELDRVLEPYGLFFAGYPMSEEVCEIGGNVAENAGGGRAVKYGVTGDYVLGLEVVTGTGEVLHLGGKRIKDVTGYDLLSLFVGSEGTLGIITQITLRLLPRPKARKAVLGFLPDESTLQQLTPALLRTLSARPSSIEMADATCLRILKSASKKWTWIPDDACMLLVEFDGIDADVLTAQIEEAATLMEEYGGLHLQRSQTEEEFQQLWTIRKQIPWALMRMSPHQTLEDVTVPVSQAWPLIARTRQLSEEIGIEIANFGHLGDGNIHCTPIKPDETDVDRWHEEVPELLGALYREVYALGGTISGEHGIGHKRRSYMPLVFAEPELQIQRGLKKLFDPDCILNPDKMF